MTREEEARKIGIEMVGPYLGVMVKTEYLCQIHGKFLQTPNKVQQGIGCQKCGRERRASKRKSSLDDIISRARKANLEYVNGYTNAVTKCIYRCERHGLIEMRPMVVSKGGSCKKCAVEINGINLRLTEEEVISRAKSIGLIFIGPYLGVDIEAKYECPKHGIFLKKPGHMYGGKGCNLCSSRPAQTEAVLQERANKVGLVYVGGFESSNKPAQYRCETHGIIEMNPAVVRRGGGCRFCSGNTPKEEDRLKEEALLVGLEFVGPYKGDSKSTIYFCSIHGEIKKRPSDVKQGKGCASCAKYGFDQSKDAVFYAFEIEGLHRSFIGYGITNDYKTRRSAHAGNLSKHGFRIKSTLFKSAMSGINALRIENGVKSSMSRFHINTGINGFMKEALTDSCRMEFINFVDNLLPQIG